jgi:hypothetical protein
MSTSACVLEPALRRLSLARSAIVVVVMTMVLMLVTMMGDHGEMMIAVIAVVVQNGRVDALEMIGTMIVISGMDPPDKMKGQCTSPSSSSSSSSS